MAGGWRAHAGRTPDGVVRNAVEDFETIRRELKLYNPELLAKPQLVAANKIDALDDPKRVTDLEKRAKKLKLKFFTMSAVTGEGTMELIEAAWPIIAKGREAELNALEQARRDAEEGDLSSEAQGAKEDYNPALVAPLSRGPRKAQADPGPQKAQQRPLRKTSTQRKVQKPKRRR